MIFVTFGTIDFTRVFAAAPGKFAAGSGIVTLITLLLFMGATGKSAQLPLYTWLPDAMEGPTPVSALIHAATMVTAGVYMVARCNVLFLLAPTSLLVVAVIGAATAIFAASIGLAQNDIKRVLAYSTISQLGYMFLACGVGAFTAGIFHLMTHAFFKALLFLGAGSVMHALAGELDMRKMGALKPHMPRTYWTFLIATLAISGIFPFAGFFSKDEILWKALTQGGIGILDDRGHRGFHDRHLHVPGRLHDLSRKVPGRSPCGPPSPRIPRDDDRSPDDPGRPLGRRGVHRLPRSSPGGTSSTISSPRYFPRAAAAEGGSPRGGV